jgi:hypothetical protein
MALENLTLTRAQLESCRPVTGEGGQVLRAYCPFHGSDSQRSLRVVLDSGHFKCFACGAWGYMAASRESWRSTAQTGSGRNQKRPHHSSASPTSSTFSSETTSSVKAQSDVSRDSSELKTGNRGESGFSLPPAVTSGPAYGQKNNTPHKGRRAILNPQELSDRLKEYQQSLEGSDGELYLQDRGVSLEVAQKAGLGYSPPGRWPNRGRDWRWGRVVFPHTDPEGNLINLYGRAVGQGDQVPKALRHDHLPGQKGYFHCYALSSKPPVEQGYRDWSEDPVFVCEGGFDALAVLAAGYPRVVALFGVHGWRWEWFRQVRKLVFALDNDGAGQKEWKQLARMARLRGKQVEFLTAEVYCGCKDLAEAWEKGLFSLEGL